MVIAAHCIKSAVIKTYIENCGAILKYPYIIQERNTYCWYLQNTQRHPENLQTHLIQQSLLFWMHWAFLHWLQRWHAELWSLLLLLQENIKRIKRALQKNNQTLLWVPWSFQKTFFLMQPLWLLGGEGETHQTQRESLLGLPGSRLINTWRLGG